MMPAFFTSEYFVPEPDNWHLKENAPQEVKEEFEAWMRNTINLTKWLIKKAPEKGAFLMR